MKFTSLELTQEEKRILAYHEESDPLFFKWQAGEVTKEEWLAKRAEIKARYPEE
jgi:hypothetical protein